MANKHITRLVSVVLTLLGIIGFFAGDFLFGFGINSLHSGVHLVTGLIGVWLGFDGKEGMPMLYNRYLGIIYIMLTLLGFIAADFMASLLNVNPADNILHLVLGVVMVGFGFGSRN